MMVTATSVPVVSAPRLRNESIDLARCVAIFGVIAIHCAPYTPAAGLIVEFFLNVCVPFFLLTSLFFFWREVQATGDATGALRRRIPRLLVPYFAWTALYLLARYAKPVLQRRPIGEELARADFVHILGAGGAGVQLYFLPLLTLALFVAWLLVPMLRRTPAWAFGLLLVASGALLLRSDWRPAATEGSPFLLLVLKYLDWALWMLPVVVLAAGIARWAARIRVVRGLGWALLGLALVINCAVMARSFYAWRLHSLVLAALVLMACLQFEDRFFVAAGRWIRPVLKTSFGVFLAHHLFLGLIEIVDRGAGWNLTRPYTVGSLILVCGVVFIVSAGFTLAVLRQPRLARVLFGQ